MPMVVHQERRVATAKAEVSWSDSDADPAGVGGHVVDAVRDGLAQIGIGEVVHVDPFGLAGRLVLRAAVLEVPDQLAG